MNEIDGSNGRTEKPYVPKQYIVSAPRQHLEALGTMLTRYELHRFEMLPYYAVTVRSKQQEQSLLEELAGIPGATYREALTRRVLDAKNDERPQGGGRS